MDIILTKDQKLEKLEKKLRELEHKIDKNFLRTNESFDTFRKVIIHLQRENAELKRDRDFLLEKYKDVLRKIELPDSLIQPVKQTINENAGFLKDIIVEGLEPSTKKKNIDDLFELVMKNKKIALKSAANKLGTTEKTALYWALKLQRQGLINVNDKLGKPELSKS